MRSPMSFIPSNGHSVRNIDFDFNRHAIHRSTPTKSSLDKPHGVIILRSATRPRNSPFPPDDALKNGRAIIFSASILPRDERNAWLEKVEASGDVLDRATAQFVR